MDCAGRRPVELPAWPRRWPRGQPSAHRSPCNLCPAETIIQHRTKCTMRFLLWFISPLLPNLEANQYRPRVTNFPWGKNTYAQQLRNLPWYGTPGLLSRARSGSTAGLTTAPPPPPYPKVVQTPLGYPTTTCQWSNFGLRHFRGTTEFRHGPSSLSPKVTFGMHIVSAILARHTTPKGAPYQLGSPTTASGGGHPRTGRGRPGGPPSRRGPAPGGPPPPAAVSGPPRMLTSLGAPPLKRRDLD